MAAASRFRPAIKRYRPPRVWTRMGCSTPCRLIESTNDAAGRGSSPRVSMVRASIRRTDGLDAVSSCST
jgi:hypothetical protein